MDHDIAIPSLILNNLAAELDKKSGTPTLIRYTYLNNTRIHEFLFA